MGPLRYFLFVYVVGGLTFIPLLLLSILLFVYYTSPDVNKTANKPPTNDPAYLVRDGDLSDEEKEKLIFKTGTDNLAEKFHRKHDSDVAAGYFAVCREYVPGGVNGKPPDKLSPAGEVVAQESPSVYQSMYRSIFDRSQKPSIEPSKDTNGKTVKKANNVFYVVLRHGHLMLYDDIQQLEVRYVISLEYHDVDLYGGEGEIIPEGELYIKRNSIRFQRKRGQQVGDRPVSLPFFFFGENLSEKEDFYHAVLKNQEKSIDDPPIPQTFETRHIVSLVQKLHSSEEQLQTRWLNALVGRWFLAIYKTRFMENLIRQKLTKKIARVKKPTFITKLALQKMDFGEGAPFMTNPRLKDLTVNGDCVVEADMDYTGGARVEIAATARIDLGSRFKAREVDLVLAMTCKRIQGRMLLRLKPPPSNRLWFTFEKMPKVEMTLEPVVSSRQITYTVILKAIESRIMEVFAESIVLPFWDDMPFFDTMGEQFRGGIWKKEPSATTSTEIKDEVPEDEAEAGEESTATPLETLKKGDRNLSMPVLMDRKDSATVRATKKSVSSLKEILHSNSPERAAGNMSRADTPRVLRAPSFANAVDPALSPTHAGANTPAWDIKAAQKRDNMLKDLSLRSLSTSPDTNGTTSFIPEPATSAAMQNRRSSNTSKSSLDDNESGKARASSIDSEPTIGSSAPESDFSLLHPDTMRSSSTMDSSTSRSSSRSRASTHESSDQQRHSKDFATVAKSLTQGDRKQAMASINAAASAAQKWGWGVIARNRQREAEGSVNEQGLSSSPSLPMGRGQPLPPPGTPLPPPVKPGLFSIPKRKPAGNNPPPLPKRSANGDASLTDEPVKRIPGTPPALPDRPERKRRQASLANNPDDNNRADELLVVEAPMESNPTTPLHEHHDDFFGHGEDPDASKKTTESVKSSSRVVKPPLPVRKDVLEEASLNTVTGGSLEKAAKEHEAEEQIPYLAR